MARFFAGTIEDIRFGLRMLRRNPAVSMLALLCLTIGIGANAAVFSWIEGVLLRPFPLVENQDRMMAIIGTKNGVPGESGQAIDLDWPDFQDVQRNSTLFDAFIVDRIMGVTLSIGNRAERTTSSLVTSNYFDALGVRPILGRGFRPEEDQGRNAHPVVVISYRLWKRRFGGDPNVIGKTQLLNNVPHTIIGVAPEGFDGTFIGWAMNLWVPLSMQETFVGPNYLLEDRGGQFIEGYVKLKPGVTAQQAQTEVTSIASRLEKQYPTTNHGRGIQLYPLWQTPFNNAGTLLPTLSIALVVVVFVLLIACANVSNLLLVRGLARRHEMTVRLAIGARRTRLLRQLLTEGFLLSVIAAAGGLLLAYWCRNLLVLLLPARGGVSMNLHGRLDARVLLISGGVCILSAMLFALVPAFHSSDVDLAGALRAEAGGVVASRRRGWVRGGLIVVQVALSFVLLVGAGLLLKSLNGMQNADPGFSLDHGLATGIDFVSAGYDPKRAHDVQERLIDRIQALPGVEAAAFVRAIPFGYGGFQSAPIAIDGSQVPADELPVIEYNAVGPSYLKAMDIPLVSGREFTRADNETSLPVAIINQAMAEQLWPRQDPIGRRIQAKDRWLQVVGVAKNSKYHNIRETPPPFYYVPLRQTTLPGGALQIRSSLAPQTLAQSMIREITAVDSNLSVGEVITMREQVERTMAPQRVALLMIGIFASLALVLATIGLYGVMAYTVSQGRREFGLRMALGASPQDLLRLIMRYGLELTAAGMVVGLAVAISSARLLGYLLYHVSPRDPAAFALAIGAMAIAAVAASVVPAWRASRTDPQEALRV